MALAIMTRHALSPSTPRTGAPLRASGVDRSARPSRGGYRAKNAKKHSLTGCARTECLTNPQVGEIGCGSKNALDFPELI